MLGVHVTRYEEIVIIEFTDIAGFVLALGMLIRAFIWIFFLKNETSIKCRFLVVSFYLIPIAHLICIFLVDYSRMPY